MNIKTCVPILRIFDEGRAREYYLGFLGFQVDWESRFGGDFPIYMQVSRGGCVLNLSEHHGDGCPGAVVRVEAVGLEDFQRELIDKKYKYSRPGIEETSWGHRELRLNDPFGNRLVFWEHVTPS